MHRQAAPPSPSPESNTIRELQAHLQVQTSELRAKTERIAELESRTASAEADVRAMRNRLLLAGVRAAQYRASASETIDVQHKKIAQLTEEHKSAMHRVEQLELEASEHQLQRARMLAVIRDLRADVFSTLQPIESAAPPGTPGQTSARPRAPASGTSSIAALSAAEQFLRDLARRDRASTLREAVRLYDKAESAALRTHDLAERVAVADQASEAVANAARRAAAKAVEAGAPRLHRLHGALAKASQATAQLAAESRARVAAEEEAARWQAACARLTARLQRRQARRRPVSVDTAAAAMTAAAALQPERGLRLVPQPAPWQAGDASARAFATAHKRARALVAEPPANSSDGRPPPAPAPRASAPSASQPALRFVPRPPETALSVAAVPQRVVRGSRRVFELSSSAPVAGATELAQVQMADGPTAVLGESVFV